MLNMIRITAIIYVLFSIIFSLKRDFVSIRERNHLMNRSIFQLILKIIAIVVVLMRL
ncbi:hypothetical protein JYU21_02345 [Alkaliphilus sp. AH-315-G20]|nr:hypothetical protein [Alkaliphilus sp. AH-315-G20]